MLDSASPSSAKRALATIDVARASLWQRLERDHLILLVVFVATRAGLYAAGLRMRLDLSWMFLSDLVRLRDHFLETIYYFHAFAPGMNVLTGALLQLGDAQVGLGAQGLFWLSGCLLLLSTYQLLRRLHFGSPASVAVALVVSSLPQSLFFENLYLYTHLCTSLLTAAAVLFERALRVRTPPAWFWFFGACSALGWLYTTFHLFWFLGLFAIALVVAQREARRSLLLGALAPALLLTALYAKNFFVFGVFGATSWGGANLTLVTTRGMPKDERARWIEEGRLSPYAAISVFAPPEVYLKFFPADLHFPWPGSNELDRPSVHDANYNHGVFLAVNEVRRRDSMEFIRARPRDYLRNVFGANLPMLFHSTTHWHPSDAQGTSVHADHRRVLGAYEHLYDRLVHGDPSQAGLYVFFPFFYVWALSRALATLRGGRHATNDAACERYRAACLLGFCLLQIAFIVSVSSLFSGLESARYRYAVEPFIWAVVAFGMRDAGRGLRLLWSRLRGSLYPATARG
jgi:hypothetical protein